MCIYTHIQIYIYIYIFRDIYVQVVEVAASGEHNTEPLVMV